MTKKPSIQLRSPLAQMLAEPRRFSFDAVFRIIAIVTKPIMANRSGSERLFKTRLSSSLSYPAGDNFTVERESDQSYTVTPTLFTLIGGGGVLPRLYTEIVANSLRGGSKALLGFLELILERPLQLFGLSGAKYRLARSSDLAKTGNKRDIPAHALLAFAGQGLSPLETYLAGDADIFRYYAGIYATQPRSADRLAALVSDWLGRAVEVRQFEGAWLPIPLIQQSRLPDRFGRAAFNLLGIDAAIGRRAWDMQGRVRLVIGPLPLAQFERLLPGALTLRRLVRLVRTFLGLEFGFAVNPVLARDEVPPLQLAKNASHAPRLGWTTWLPQTTPLRRDAADACFDAETIEAYDHSLAKLGHG